MTRLGRPAVGTVGKAYSQDFGVQRLDAALLVFRCVSAARQSPGQLLDNRVLPVAQMNNPGSKRNLLTVEAFSYEARAACRLNLRAILFRCC